MKIKKNKLGIIEEITKQEFIHKLLLYIEHNGADYSDPKMYEIHKELQKNDYEWTLDNYDIYFEKFDVDIMAKMMDCKIIKY